MEHHYQKLAQLALLLKSLYPSDTTVHKPVETIKKEAFYPKDLRGLFEMLVHTLTLINKLYRQQDAEGNYISQREDYATALQLLSPLFEAKTLDLPESVRSYYQQLLTEIGYSKSFTWKEVKKITGKSKTRCNNILNQLKGLGLVKQSGKGYRDIYLYELVQMQQPKPGIWEEMMGQWENFKGWEEF
jgi:predicted transcriptional regulator